MADSEVEECVQALRQMSYKDAVIGGTELYSSAMSRVTEHITGSGRKIAVKIRHFGNFLRSEADLVEYADKSGVRVNTCRGYYDIVALDPARPIGTVLVSDRLPGEPLDRVWDSLSPEERVRIKEQLQEQFRAMRSCRLPYVGRPGHQPNYNVFRDTGVFQFGPFDTEDAFDLWCLQQIRSIIVPPFVWARIAKILERPTQDRGVFVLTHACLMPSHVIVDGDKLSGMVGWEHAGFYPPYAEYAFYRKFYGSRQPWWQDIILEQLEPCSRLRLYLTGRLERKVCMLH
jgi:hypothetical protein